MQKLLVSNTVSIINIKISRWLSEVKLSSDSLSKKGHIKFDFQDLKTQIGLLGTNQDLYKEAADAGRLTEDLNMKVDIIRNFNMNKTTVLSFEGGLLWHLHQSLVLWLFSRGQIRGPGAADVRAGARPDHRGAAQRDEPLLHQPVPGQLQPRRILHHRKPPAKVLSPASEVEI